VLFVAITARIDEGPPTKSIDALHAAAETLVSRMRSISAAASVQARALRIADVETEKSGRPTTSKIQLDAAVEIPLEVHDDYWVRARRAAIVVESLGALASELGKGKPPIRLAWRSPVARVADAEVHRAALSERWRSHVCSLLASDAPTTARFDTSIEIRQTDVSLDEVRLQLTDGRER